MSVRPIWFLALPSNTAVRVEPSPRDHIATKQRKDAYSRTIADLFLTPGSRPDLARMRRNDMKWDLAKGSIWVDDSPVRTTSHPCRLPSHATRAVTVHPAPCHRSIFLRL